jgi:hypothetical protein
MGENMIKKSWVQTGYHEPYPTTFGIAFGGIFFEYSLKSF